MLPDTHFTRISRLQDRRLESLPCPLSNIELKLFLSKIELKVVISIDSNAPPLKKEVE
jgi:hypothetical protein